MKKELFSRDDWEKNKPLDKWEKNCPLCKEKDLIIWEWEYLRVIHNKHPILWLQNHLMVIPKRHVIHTKDINSKEASEMIEVEKFMSDFYENENYFSFIRQTLDWKSLAHIHYHYLPWILYYENLEQMLKKQWFPKNTLWKV